MLLYYHGGMPHDGLSTKKKTDMTKHNELSHSYILSAGESNATGRMPITLVTERIIEVATEHANLLGIGYDTLITKNLGWVLSRLCIEMSHYPVINEHYTVTTWIETYNRHFSERNFVFTDCKGQVIGYARTVWVPMNFETRTVADISAFEREAFPIADSPCPIEKVARIAPVSAAAETEEYTFKYCDIDFNRHVNTVRYLDLILNHWPLDRYDKMMVRRLDLLFHQECHFGETIKLLVSAENNSANDCELSRDGNRVVAARLTWSELVP